MGARACGWRLFTEQLAVICSPIWCNLKDSIKDVEFIDSAGQYCEYLQAEGLVAGYRITRGKLGLGLTHLPGFHFRLDFEDLTQVDAAFNHISSRAGLVESFHRAVNSKVKDISCALYRYFPDSGRVRGQEKF